MNIFKLFLVFIIPVFLLFSVYGGYKYGSEKNLFKSQTDANMTYEVYDLTKTSEWNHRFDYLQSKEYNSIKRAIIGTRENYLQVRREQQTYLIQYDAQIDIDLIKGVRQVREEKDNFNYEGRYFLVQYDRFVEIVYSNTEQSTTFLSEEKENGTYEAEICLELPIQESANVRYHIDEHNNIWIATASMNKVVFVQIYSCREKKLLKEFRHILKDEQYVNEISKIIKQDKDCMSIEVVTYNLNIVQLQVCPYSASKSIKQSPPRKSHQMNYHEVQIKDYQILQGKPESLYQQEFSRISQYIINLLTFSPNSTLLYDRKPSIDQNKKDSFDIIGVDTKNNYLINFSQNTSYTGIMSLGKYLINSKNPLFHNNPSYNQYDALKILDREYKKEYNPDVQHKFIVPGVNQTKKVVYKAAYPTYPDFKIEYLGLTTNVIVFWPQQKLEEKDYTFVRTHEGGLVSEGNKFKGTFDKVPVLYEQVYQRVDSKAQEVIPSIFEVHTGYFNLMSYLIRSKDDKQFIRIELLNMLGGRPVLTHYLNIKEGYRYISTTLLNNQWWILQYSQQAKRSIATKYEIYANASNPTQILSLKRTYGVIDSEEDVNGEDDLASLMEEFISKHNNGFILLNVYRCIDEYYYVQYSDSDGSVFGVARIHFKNFSNRRIKKSKKYSGNFEKLMLLDDKQMIPEKYSRKPYSVYLKNVDAFRHIPSFLAKGEPNQTWYDYCDQRKQGANFKRFEKYGGFYYFPISHYGVGNYDCDFNSDAAHSQKIYVFNLRNIIINGKIQKQDKAEVRRDIIYLIFKIACGYLALIALFLIVQTFVLKKSENPSNLSAEKQETKSKSKKEKSN